MTLTLARAVDLFLRDYDDKPSTKNSYGKALKPLVEFFGDDVDVREISTVEMKLFDQWFKKRPARTLTGKLAVATIRSRYKTIGTFFGWVMELDETLTSKPSRVLKKPPIPERIDEDRAMSDEDFMKLLIAARSNPRNFALFCLLGFSGVRASDAADLRLGALDLDSCTAVVIGKGDRQRRIWFGTQAATAIQEWLAVREDEGHDYVFSSTHRPKGLDADDIALLMRRLCVKAGIKARSTHSLRYRFVKLLVDAGVDEQTRMIIMGHRSIEVHRGYMPAETARASKAVLDVTTPYHVPDPESILKPAPKSKNIISFPPKLG